MTRSSSKQKKMNLSLIQIMKIFKIKRCRMRLFRISLIKMKRKILKVNETECSMSELVENVEQYTK